jgi:hypothetical protein
MGAAFTHYSYHEPRLSSALIPQEFYIGGLGFCRVFQGLGFIVPLGFSGFLVPLGFRV